MLRFKFKFKSKKPPIWDKLLRKILEVLQGFYGCLNWMRIRSQNRRCQRNCLYKYRIFTVPQCPLSNPISKWKQRLSSSDCLFLLSRFIPTFGEFMTIFSSSNKLWWDVVWALWGGLGVVPSNRRLRQNISRTSEIFSSNLSLRLQLLHMNIPGQSNLDGTNQTLTLPKLFRTYDNLFHKMIQKVSNLRRKKTVEIMNENWIYSTYHSRCMLLSCHRWLQQKTKNSRISSVSVAFNNSHRNHRKLFQSLSLLWTKNQTNLVHLNAN
jgi:hypothetical protein